MTPILFEVPLSNVSLCGYRKRIRGIKIMCRLISLIGLALLQACSSSDSNPLASDEITFAITYGFYNDDNIKIENHQSEPGLRLIFPAVPGTILGNISDDILHDAEVVDSKKFDLTLSNNVDDMAAFVTRAELTAIPTDAKILRLGTFHSLPSYDGDWGGGGFIDTESGLSMLLVYVSKPVDIRGTTNSPTNQYDHQISISQAGWHWLQSSPLSATSFQISEFAGNTDNIEFKIILPGE